MREIGSVGDLLIDAIERHGNRVAFEAHGTTTTYAELGKDVAQAILFFEECGLQQGDRIAQISANRYEQFVVIAAAYIGGYVSLALQYNSDLDEHSFAIDDLKPALLFVDEERAARASELVESTSHSFRICTYDEIQGVFSDDPGAAPGIGSFLGRTDASKCARINQTGGTSGRPKAVMISSAALTYTILAHATANAFDGKTRLLVASPISHGGEKRLGDIGEI